MASIKHGLHGYWWLQGCTSSTLPSPPPPHTHTRVRARTHNHAPAPGTAAAPCPAAGPLTARLQPRPRWLLAPRGPSGSSSRTAGAADETARADRTAASTGQGTPQRPLGVVWRGPGAEGPLLRAAREAAASLAGLLRAACRGWGV